MTNASCLNILGLILQIVGIIVVGASVKTVSREPSSFSGGEFIDNKTRKYVTIFTLPKPLATWIGIMIILAGLVFQIIAEIIR